MKFPQPLQFFFKNRYSKFETSSFGSLRKELIINDAIILFDLLVWFQDFIHFKPSNDSYKFLTKSVQNAEVNSLSYYTAKCFLANYLESIGLYEEALMHAQASFHADKDEFELEICIQAYSVAGNICFRTNKLQEAIYYFNTCLHLSKSAQNLEAQASAHNQLGRVFFHQKQYEFAIHHYSEAEQIRKQIKNLSALNWTLLGKAQVLFAIQQQDIGFDTIHEAIEGCKTFEDERGEMNALHVILQHRFTLPNFERAKALANHLEAKHILADLYLFASNYFEHLGFFKEALHYMQQHLQVKDELFNNDTALNIQKMNSKFEIERAQLEARLTEEKNREIEESIRYAQRIQEAILPQLKTLEKLLPNSALYFMQRDIVGGDFYWIHEGANQNEIILAVGDCTGHGIPGGFMTMIALNSLQKIVIEKHVSACAEILFQLNNEVSIALKQHLPEVSGKDGMEIVILKIDLSNGNIQYSSANRPVWKVSSSGVEIFPITKMGVGGYGLNIQYEQHQFRLEKSETVILFSDGITDQFGGEKGKKFRTSYLKELCSNYYSPNLKDYFSKLEKEIIDWKKDEPQTDDQILLLFQLP